VYWWIAKLANSHDGNETAEEDFHKQPSAGNKPELIQQH
jgi:hypothetical protein